MDIFVLLALFFCKLLINNLIFIIFFDKIIYQVLLYWLINGGFVIKGHLKSIRYKLILILLLCSILPLSFSMCITYIYSRNNFSNEIISYNEQLMYQFSNNINTYLCDVSNGIYYPFSNAKMYSFLTKKDSSHYNDHNTIMTFMQSIQNLSNDIV